MTTRRERCVVSTASQLEARRQRQIQEIRVKVSQEVLLFFPLGIPPGLGRDCAILRLNDRAISFSLYPLGSFLNCHAEAVFAQTNTDEYFRWTAKRKHTVDGTLK